MTAPRFDSKDKNLYFVPLGGSNEIGMNLNLYFYQGKWLMIDLGIGFADDYLPGVDVVLPSLDFILEHKENLAGLVLTHAHEDHLGAVPYLWGQLECPVYATPFTANVLKAKLAMDKGPKIPLNEVQPGSSFNVGPFSLEMVPLTHSIPEMNAIAIHTEHGDIFHTGDWKLDPEPQVGESSDEASLQRYGEKGVLAMVCDSTNVFVEGESGSEQEVRTELTRLIGECKNRVLVTTFASNVARLDTVIHAAQAAGRQVGLAGRSMQRMVQAAKDSGYLKDIKPVISDKEAMDLPRSESVILATGSQGEPRAALARIASGDHPVIRLSPADTVIFSSRDIPGNEKKISWIQNKLVEQDLELITADKEAIHVSGHPARDELTRMYQWIKPQIAVPVHGEARHLAEHARLAKTLQVPQSVVGHNGAVIKLAPGKPEIVTEVESGYMCLEGASMIPSDSAVIRTRRRIRDHGVVFVSLVIGDKNELAAAPYVVAPGLLDVRDDEEWLHDIEDDIADLIERKGRKAGARELEEGIRSLIRKTFKTEFSKRPIIHVNLAKVD